MAPMISEYARVIYPKGFYVDQLGGYHFDIHDENYPPEFYTGYGYMPKALYGPFFYQGIPTGTGLPPPGLDGLRSRYVPEFPVTRRAYQWQQGSLHHEFKPGWGFGCFGSNIIGMYDALSFVQRDVGPLTVGPRVACKSKVVISFPDTHTNKPSIEDGTSTAYENAKFFIMKPSCENDVHKSIKNGVWTSTQHGNAKLDSAYREARRMHGTGCPVFLIYSVNCSGQFVGVAEMVGSVDNSNRGQFPVKWHIVKDVPDRDLRHLLLPNNDLTPLTQSRDTQEVKVREGVEVLKIFKKYKAQHSMMDDFEFYEERERLETEMERGREEVSGGNEEERENEENGADLREEEMGADEGGMECPARSGGDRVRVRGAMFPVAALSVMGTALWFHLMYRNKKLPFR